MKAGRGTPIPTVRPLGERSAGWRALCAAQEVGLPVLALRRARPVNDGEPSGSYWEIVFRCKGRPKKSVQPGAMIAERVAAST